MIPSQPHPCPPGQPPCCNLNPPPPLTAGPSLWPSPEYNPISHKSQGHMAQGLEIQSCACAPQSMLIKSSARHTSSTK